MPEPESPRIAAKDDLSGVKRESRAARLEATKPDGADSPAAGTRVRVVPSDDVLVASEPMVIQRLHDGDDAATHAPAGRQRTGDPPATRA
jgi:hypothetical protein